MADIFNIAGRIHSTSQEEVVTTTNEILDDTNYEGGKKQSEVNQEVIEELALHTNRLNALTGQNYTTVQATQSTTVADIPTLINATGEGEQTDTLYRVGFWDGSAYVADKYTEYAWNGTDYVILDVKPSIGEVFDISAYHATGGELATYADLDAALDSNNGGGVPQSIQRGGMSVKFVQSSDNKYVQYRLMTAAFSTSESDWESIDTVTKNSQYDFAISDGAGNNIVEMSDGHIKTKNFDSSKDATGEERGLMSAEDKSKLNTVEEDADVNDVITMDDENADLNISDENGNILIQAKNGHIKTKNFDSENINNNIESSSDFAVSDNVGNDILRVKNGFIKTKNFDSERETLAIPKTLFKLNHRTNEYVVASGWQTIDDYITNNGNYGWDNKLVIDREITITDKFFVIDFSVGNSAIAYFGSVGSYRTTDSKQSLVSVDFTTGKLNIHYYIPATYSMPNIFKSVSFNNTDYTNKKYRITINRSNMVLKVTLFDITTEYKEIATVSCTFTSTGTPCGHLYDKPMCFSSGADIKIYNFIVAVPLNKTQKCHILIEGDSITGGWSVQNPEKDSYGFMLAKDFPNSMVKVSGRGNGSIRNLIDSANSTSGRLASEAAILKPDYVMVTIGTNDSDIVGTFPTYLQYLIDYVCDTIGSKLILNHIPESQTFSLAPTMNAMIDSAIENNSSKDILCCKFDVCTAIDFDISKGQDSSLFADGAHPNEKGYIRMYNQVKIDCPELFNY